MSVRVVARIRPLLKTERELDVIVRTGSSATAHQQQGTEKSASGGVGSKKLTADKDRDNIVRIPNPKNGGEEYSFQFNGVYDGDVSQQDVFDAEVAPTIKHLFNGFDVTIFAYGVTGTGKTHTMRGGKTLADRGVIPRLLSGIYRRSRKVEKDSDGEATVDVVMSYYEIYNDKVFDLFEPPEKRTPSGLPLRDNGGKTVVVGLTERPCPSLKEFESLYDQANVNRSTSATKLNAHSSRSHAILRVKVIVTTGEKTRVSTASAIDLAGSEDNRRTENGKERMVESASINKSLFVLAQCVEAMSKKQNRIPYRESKMTRILSLGQNQGLTIMILNLAPLRSYHLDTLSSLNFANRTKKIEIREAENEPMFKGPPRAALASARGGSMNRQPLRPLAASINVNITAPAAKDAKPNDGKPVKAFSVYSDKRLSAQFKKSEANKKQSPLKRGAEIPVLASTRPAKLSRPTETPTVDENSHEFSAAKIEELVEKKVQEIMAARCLDENAKHNISRTDELNERVQRRLELLEQRIEGNEDARAEGLSYLLMAKQHHSRGEEASALKMYQLALPFFPTNDRLAGKISTLKEKLRTRASKIAEKVERKESLSPVKTPRPTKRQRLEPESDDDYEEPDRDEGFSDEDFDITDRFQVKPKTQKSAGRLSKFVLAPRAPPSEEPENTTAAHSPRTSHLLRTINSRNVSQIKLLRGVGPKKAEAIVDCLCGMDVDSENPTRINSLADLEGLKGVGLRTVETMRNGVEV